MPAGPTTRRTRAPRAHAAGVRSPLSDELADVDTVLRRAMARNADDRFGNVLELAHAVRAAARLGVADVEIPRLDDELRSRYLLAAPQPLAEAVQAFCVARNAHQAREALRGLLRATAWYVGVLALACRTQ